MNDTDKILAREKIFHDNWASQIDIDRINIETFFEGSTCPENRFILKHLGDVNGKYLLDLGCGSGENSIYFAEKGAICFATDISSEMIKAAMLLASKHKVKIEGKVMNAMKIDFPDNTFDIVYAANLLHHVDPFKTLDEIKRVLKPGGKLCFWDPLKHNPVINIYRRISKDVRTPDERPLDIKIVKYLKKNFLSVNYDTFWFFTLWIFIQFYFIERIDPNKERYWKKIIWEEKRLRKLYYSLEFLDKLLKKVPFIKRFAWNISVVATK